MPAEQLATKFLAVDTTAICDADKATRVLDSAIRARSANSRVFGPAFTVRCRGDFFAVLRAVETAAPGDVIVVDGGGSEIAYAGELFARGALVRGLGGIIVDGGYRAAEATVIARLDAGSTLSDGLNIADHTAALQRGEHSVLQFLP